jgi:hypothetical protein
VDKPGQVEIQEVQTNMVITENVGSLSREQVQKLIALVLEHIDQRDHLRQQREKDTAINNRVDSPHVR